MLRPRFVTCCSRQAVNVTTALPAPRSRRSEFQRSTSNKTQVRVSAPRSAGRGCNKSSRQRGSGGEAPEAAEEAPLGSDSVEGYDSFQLWNLRSLARAVRSRVQS